MIATDTTPSSRTEVRYALVLNGGVSLAIWMGGVTHEVNSLRMASLPADPDATDADPVREVWKKVLDETKSSVVIDLVAGTSAGGLNGSLIASAVAHGRDLPYMRDVWTRLASLDVGKLTRSSPYGINSMLDGDYFRRSIDGLFRRFYRDEFRSDKDVKLAGDEEAPLPQVTDGRDCTLLVTATALNTPVLLPPLSARDGRRVYKFQYRIERPGVLPQDDFSDGLRLATAARASASFPIAFDPVREPDGLAALNIIGSGRTNPVTAPAEQWLADGGVLDNAPFEPILDAIRAAPIGAPFRRSLVYVTPGVGERPGPTPKAGQSQFAPPLPTLMGWLFSAIREPDERLDRDSLTGLFNEMRYTESRPDTIFCRAFSSTTSAEWRERTAPFLQAAEKLFPHYRVARGEAFERWLANSSTEAPGPLAPPDRPVLELDKLSSIPRTFRSGDASDWTWGFSSADRILRWWGRALNQLQVRDTDAGRRTFGKIDSAQAFTTWHLGEVATRVTRAGDLKSRATSYTDYIGAGNPSPSRQTAVLMSEVASDLCTALTLDVTDFMDFAKAVEVVACTLGWSAADGDAPVLHFLSVTPDLTPPFDLFPATGRDGKAVDMTRWPALKLFGERWKHFGAFSSEENRKHDWLWGRIDGATHLCAELCKAADVDEAACASFQDELFRAVLKSEGIKSEAARRGAQRAMEADPRSLYADLVATREGRRAIDQLKNAGLVLSDKFFEGKATWFRRLAKATISSSWTALTPPGATKRSKVVGVFTGLLGRTIRGGLKTWSALRKIPSSGAPTI